MKLLILPLGLPAMSASELETEAPQSVGHVTTLPIGANPDYPHNPAIRDAGSGTVKPQTLGEPQPGRRKLAVDCREGGCAVPIVVMETIEN